ncbi:hypothetical protein [Paraburkholderia sp.]|uniref:hypothetical protein n=1 Tax=Paraburkholderia sp. TaxID=1926495 RepID=UPI003D6EE1E6
MKRIYRYKGFEVAVELEPQWEVSGNIWSLPPKGFLAVVSVCISGATRPMVAPIRLAADGQQLFATEGDALMAGYSAGQRIVDDTLVR